MLRSGPWLSYVSGTFLRLTVSLQAFNIAYSVGLVARVPYGMGKHFWDVTPQEFFPNYLKWFLVVASLYVQVLWAFKMAILMLYLRLFSANRRFKTATLAVIAFVTLYSWVSVFTLIFACRPINKFWDPTVDGTCVNLYVTAVFFAALNVLSDIIIFILPLPLVWALHMNKRVRVGLAFVFVTAAL